MEYLMFLFMAEFVFVFDGKWAKRVPRLVIVMVEADADGWLLVICELWCFSTTVLVALVGGCLLGSRWGRGVGKCPSVDTRIRSTGCWRLAVVFVLALAIGVGKTHSAFCSFLLFVREIFLFLTRSLPWWTVGFSFSASLSDWIIAKIFLLPPPDVASYFCSTLGLVTFSLPLPLSI